MDLDPPADLLARWGALAAVCAVLGDDFHTVSADAADANDYGGNWAALRLPGGGRAVLFGYDHEYSRTVDASPPIDVLDQAPDWLPWAELIPRAADDQLAFCYWFDGQSWERAPGSDAVDDGSGACIGEVLTESRALAYLADMAAAAPAEQLLAAAHQRAVTGFHLQAMATGNIPAGLVQAGHAGLVQAGHAGLSAGTPDPLARPPVATPPRPARRRRRLSDDQHHSLVIDAMRTAQEAVRPVPAYSKQAGELVHWLEEQGRLDPRTDVMLRLTAMASTSNLRGLPFQAWNDCSARAAALRAAEADPDSGRWTFLRVRRSAGRLRHDGQGVELDRAYDHIPDWWTGDVDSLSLSDLRQELAGRGPAWLPPWHTLLDAELAWEIVPGA